jgi:hypothetical protein
MPLENGDYVQRTDDEIQNEIEGALRSQFGDIDLSETAVFEAWADAIANVLAANQEQSLDTLYDSAFVDTAEGESLENVVELIGIERSDGTDATGSVTFSRSSPAEQSYTIPEGTTVSTGTGLSYTTTEAVALELLHDFDGSSPLNDFSGDTGSFQIDSSTTYDGSSGALFQAPQNAGAITSDTATSSRGMSHSCRLYFEADDGAGPDEIDFAFLTDRNGSVSGGYRVNVNVSNDEIQLLHNSTAVASDTSSTVPREEWLRVEAVAYVDETLEATVYAADGSEITTLTHDESQTQRESYYDGTIGFLSSNGSTYIDEVSMTAVTADIQANEVGEEYNIGDGSITEVASGLSGVERITNRFAIGNTNIFDTSGQRLVAGQGPESDEELRERAKETTSGGGGSATVDAIASNVRTSLDNVTSVTVFGNDTDTADANGLPAYSFEVVVANGDPSDIARAIFDRKGVTSTDESGNYGTSVTQTVTSNETGDDYTIEFSRPTVVDIDITLDIVVTEDFSGKADIKDDIVEYIGGVQVDGSIVDGTDVGEDVYVDEVTDRVVGDENGVVGISQISTTPSITQDSNGLDTIGDIATEEVAETVATDNSITINVTQQ